MNDFSINLSNFIVTTFPEKINEALEKAAQIVENDAKRECPVDDGTLRASITHATDDHSATIGTNCEYACYVHNGTGIYAEEGNGRQTPWVYKSSDGKFHTTKGQKPNPFLEKSFDKNIEKIKQCFEELF